MNVPIVLGVSKALLLAFERYGLRKSTWIPRAARFCTEGQLTDRAQVAG
jgi:hypothetical protein